MTNEQVIEAVNRLTETYNALRDTFNTDFAEVKRQAAILQPLYKNGQIIWDGREDFQMTDEPLTNLIGVGTGAVSRYGKWNAQYMLKLTGHTVISNCETQTPSNYVVIKVKLPENKDGTFFIKRSNDDNWSYGIATAWMCNTDKSIKKLLGSQVADKHADYGKSVVFNPKNQDAWDSRYYQWTAFNYNKEDIIKNETLEKDKKDDKDLKENITEDKNKVESEEKQDESIKKRGRPKKVKEEVKTDKVVEEIDDIDDII